MPHDSPDPRYSPPPHEAAPGRFATERPLAHASRHLEERALLATARAGIEAMLRLAGRDPAEEDLRETPDRVLRAWAEMTAGALLDPARILAKTFPVGTKGVVMLRRVEFASVCEHHLLPFAGTATVGYIPGKVVGISKLARLVRCFAERPQVQERMTAQIADTIKAHLNPEGVMVIARAQHQCMSCRGVRLLGAEMVTSEVRGVFADDPAARAEFLALDR